MPKATPPLESCPDCGHLVSAKAKVCPKCGCPFEEELAPRQKLGGKKGIGCCGLIALAGALGVGGFMVLVIIGMIQSAGKGPRPQPAEALPPAPATGSIEKVEGTQPEPLPDLDTIQEAMGGEPPVLPRGETVELSGDETGACVLAVKESILDAILAGQSGFRPGEEVFGTSPSVPARVLGGHGEKLIVIVLIGPWAGHMGWVHASEVRKLPTSEEMAADVVDGLPQDRRRELYRKLYAAGLQASREAAKRYGDSSPVERSSFYKARRRDLVRQTSRHDLVTPSVLDRIEEEGMKQHWPLEDYSRVTK